ncbi:MAG: hypothetical protein ACI4OY_02225 [Aristaeellaceae bacterium]
MGSFASGVFSAMLGWIRGAIAYLWNAAATPEGGGLLSWMAGHWLPLTLILCGAGMVIDLIVYLLRWQPYKVWASFFRRLGHRRQQEEEEELPPRPARRKRTVHRQWLYADGTARTEAVVQEVHPEEDPAPWQNVAPAVADQELTREEYMRQYARPEEVPDQTPAPGLEDYPQPVIPPAPPAPAAVPASPAPSNRPEPEEMPEPVSRGRRIVRQSTRAAFQQLFSSHDEDELDLRYKPAQPAVDKAQAYNKPYYPPQWKPPADAGASRNE